MPNFIYIFHGTPNIDTPEAGQKMMADWQAWHNGMADAGAIVDDGHPVGQSHTVHKDGVDDHGGANPLSGYTVVTAADMAAACEMAKSCPLVLSGDGSIEVAQCMDMSMNG